MNIFQTFKNIRDNKIFEAFVISVILISAISIGFRTFDESINPGYFLWLGYIDYLITVIFLIEIIIRVIAERNILKFFKQGWNIFDFSIVAISLIPIENSETVFLARLVRIFRLMRLFSFVPQFRILIEALKEILTEGPKDVKNTEAVNHIDLNAKEKGVLTDEFTNTFPDEDGKDSQEELGELKSIQSEDGINKSIPFF